MKGSIISVDLCVVTESKMSSMLINISALQKHEQGLNIRCLLFPVKALICTVFLCRGTKTRT